MSRPIILTGPMGAGKSAIGRRLARILSVPFHDTDLIVQERSGVDIGFIFEKEGEAGFRRREENVIAALVERDGVIATGGGAILSPANRERMASKGIVVFLETNVDWQLARTQRSRHRPLLDDADPGTRLAEIYAAREPLYRECAAVVINTDGRRVSAVASAVLKALERDGLLP